MKWLMLTAALVLPPVAFVASHLPPHQSRPAKLPRLIDRHGLQNHAPVLGIMLTAPQVAAR